MEVVMSGDDQGDRVRQTDGRLGMREYTASRRTFSLS